MTADVPPVDGVVLLAESSALAGGHGSIDELLDVIGAAVAGGVRTVVVRDKHRPIDERRALVAGVRSLLDPRGGTVLIAHDDPDSDLLGADGVHLRSGAAPPARRPGIIGASAHDAAEIDAAAAAGADYVTVSPVHPTASKPGYGPPLGVDGLAALVAHSPVPVVALGGITTSTQAAECMDVGAVGVAVMGAILRATDPAAISASLTAAARHPQNSARYRSVSGLNPAEFSPRSLR